MSLAGLIDIARATPDCVVASPCGIPVIAGPGSVLAVDWRMRLVPAKRHPEEDLLRLR